jgi:tetratricopeptide (TPR) repeat protein
LDSKVIKVGGVAKKTKQRTKFCLAGLTCLFLSSMHAIAGPDEWQKHMDAAVEAFVASDYAEAGEHYKAAVNEAEEFGADDPRLAESLNGLAVAYREQGHYDEAEPLFKRALSMREKVLGPTHPDVVQSLNNLAGFYHDQGRFAEAEPLYKRSLAIDEQALGPDHPDVAVSLNNLAALYKVQGHHAQAEPLYRRSLAIKEKALGPEHPRVATSLNNLAALYYAQGRYAGAEPLYRQRPGETLLRPRSLRRSRAALQARFGDQ